MAAGALEEEIPSPSRVLLYAIAGLVVLAVFVITITLMRHQNAPASTSSLDKMEKEIAAVYGAESVLYSNPSENTITVTFQGRELKCVAPSEAELRERKPMQCMETLMLNAK